MSERRSKAILLAALGWIVIIAILAIAYRLMIRPASRQRLADETGSESRYHDEVVLALDSFSGYCLLRSDALREALRGSGIKLVTHDDGADYAARIRALQAGDADMATFTVDSLITAGAALGEHPATVVLLIDETHGADAIVARSGAVRQLQDLSDPSARIVLTPSSPSEFLARTVIAHFNLPALAPNWLEPASGAADVLRKLRAAGERDKRAFVLWEPYLSQALEVPGVEVLIDSSRLKGYIVDVLVAERGFLRNHPQTVQAVVEAYLRTRYTAGQSPERMVELVQADAELTGSPRLSAAQAHRLVAGIQWKNTLENYVHFGLVPDGQSRDLPHIEDIVTNITNVLVKTGAVAADPLGGKAHTLFYDRVLRDLQAGDFHPDRRLDVISDLGPGVQEVESVQPAVVLPQLSAAQWAQLLPVGELRVEPIRFARGTARINFQSERELAMLAERLNSYPAYYLEVVGHARAEGDPEANTRLALERAQAAVEKLRELGVASQRVQARAADPSGLGAAAQSVTFEVGQMPY